MQVRKVLTYANHPNLGWVVMVGKNRTGAVKDYLLGLLAKIARAKYERVASFEEAREYIKSVDPDVDWSSVNLSLQATLMKTV